MSRVHSTSILQVRFVSVFLKGLIFASAICFCSSTVFEPKLCLYAFNVFQYNERTHPHPPGSAPQHPPDGWRVILATRPPLFASHYRTQRSPDIRKSKIDHPSENPKFPIEKILSQKNIFFYCIFEVPTKIDFWEIIFWFFEKNSKKLNFASKWRVVLGIFEKNSKKHSKIKKSTASIHPSFLLLK